MRFEQCFQMAVMSHDLSLDYLFNGPENSFFENGGEFKFRSIEPFREYMYHIIDIIKNSKKLKERAPFINNYRDMIDEIVQSEHSIGRPKIHTIDEAKELAYERLKKRKEKKLFE